MAHHTRIRANLAAWANNSAVLNTEYDALDGAQFSAIDGDAGGVWSPAAQVVVGGAGLVSTGPSGGYGSSDFSAATQALNWPERASIGYTGGGGGPNALTPVAYFPATFSAGGRWVAAATDGFMYSSEDGSIWTQRSFVTATAMGDIAAGLFGITPALIAVNSSSATAYQSFDGLTWTAMSPAPSAAFTAVCYAPSLGIWVAVGNGTVSTYNGTAWTVQSVPGGWSGKAAKRIAWNGSIFVIATSTSYNKVLTSPDGVTWTERTIGLTANWAGVAWGSFDGCWLLISTTGVVYRSTDAITWTAAFAGGFGGPPATDIAVINSLWCASTSGAASGLYWSTNKGNAWSRVNVGSHLNANMQGYYRIVSADNRFAMVRQSGAVIESILSIRSA